MLEERLIKCITYVTWSISGVPVFCLITIFYRPLGACEVRRSILASSHYPLLCRRHFLKEVWLVWFTDSTFLMRPPSCFFYISCPYRLFNVVCWRSRPVNTTHQLHRKLPNTKNPLQTQMHAWSFSTLPDFYLQKHSQLNQSLSKLTQCYSQSYPQIPWITFIFYSHHVRKNFSFNLWELLKMARSSSERTMLSTRNSCWYQHRYTHV